MGFSETAAIEELPLNKLRPVEDLIEHLDQLMQTVTPTSTADSNNLVNLSQWFQNIFDSSWQIETLLHSTQSSVAYNFGGANQLLANSASIPAGNVRRAKLIDFDPQPIALIVELTPISQQKTHILLQLHHTDSQNLPPLLQLKVVNDGVTFLEAETRSADNFIRELGLKPRPLT